MISIYTQNKYIQKKLTAFDGELVGASVGLRGALEGEWLGLDDGCSDMRVTVRNIMLRYPLK